MRTLLVLVLIYMIVVPSTHAAEDMMAASDRSLKALAEGMTQERASVKPEVSPELLELPEPLGPLESSKPSETSESLKPLELLKPLKPPEPSDDIWNQIVFFPDRSSAMNISSSEREIELNLKYLNKSKSSVNKQEINFTITIGDTPKDISSNLNYLYRQRGLIQAAPPGEFDPERDAKTQSNLKWIENTTGIPLGKAAEVGLGPIAGQHGIGSAYSNGYREYTDIDANLNYIYESASQAETKSSLDFEKSQSIDLKGSLQQPLPTDGLDKAYGTHKGNKGSKNYAIIVGINNYADRRGLNAPVNDANAIASILNAYGYDIIKLTDETSNKPTKHNILDGALAEIELKGDRDKVIFYFSGHAMVDAKGDYYLIPQDADGEPSSYICSEELSRYLKGIKNLAVIIDACNSGKIKYNLEKGQLALTSSSQDEPSNEEWPGSFSVFTYQLCNAIKEERMLGKEIALQRCFYKARDNTIQWSSQRLLKQTPEIVDMTDGLYYLN